MADPRRGPWRLIVPEAPTRGPRADAMVDALAPLAALRGALPPLRYAPPRTSITVPAPELWVEAWDDELARTEAVLLVGDAADLPWELGVALGRRLRVGRLDLGSAEALGRYADKVVRWETAPPAEAGGLLGFVAPTDEATRGLRDGVVLPACAATGGRVLQPPAGVDELLHALEAAPPGSVALIAAHGFEDGIPRGDLSALGAPVDTVGRMLRVGDLPGPERRVLPGGIACLLCCSSAGVGAVRAWAGALPGASPATPAWDVSAPLPAALLGHPGGPVAVLAHVDTLFSFSLRGLAAQGQAGPASPGARPLQRLVAELHRGAGAGVAARHLRVQALAAEADYARALGALRDGTARRRSDAVVLPTLRWSETRGWVILEDPLARRAGPIAEGGP